MTIGLDTNVLVRLIEADDAAQANEAKVWIRSKLADGEILVVSLLVLLETEWVLRSRYGRNREIVLTVFKDLLDTGDLAVEDEGAVEIALTDWEENGGEFADCLIAARNQSLGCETTVTFDRRAKRLPGFTGL